MTLKPKILVERKPNRTDPIFYEGDVMSVDYKGYTFFAWTAGEVKIYNKNNDDLEITNFKGGEICWLCENGGRDKPLTDTDLTDGDLHSEAWVWENNNWFEMSAKKQGVDEIIDLSELTNDWDEAYRYLSDEKNLDKLIEYWSESK